MIWRSRRPCARRGCSFMVTRGGCGFGANGLALRWDRGPALSSTAVPPSARCMGRVFMPYHARSFVQDSAVVLPHCQAWETRFMTPRSEHRLRALPLVLLLYGPAAPAQTQPVPVSLVQDYADGRRLLDAAIAATGDSAALAGLGGLQGSFCARAVEIGQSARPDAPYDTIRAAGVRTYDLAHRRYAETWGTVFRGGLPLALREVVTDTSAASLDLRGGVIMSVVPSGLGASLRRVEDNAPYAPLALLQRARKASLSVRVMRSPGSG